MCATGVKSIFGAPLFVIVFVCSLPWMHVCAWILMYDDFVLKPSDDVHYEGYE